MAQKLNGKVIAIVATHGFEHSELFEPMKALKAAGATVEILSLKLEEIKSWEKNDWGEKIKADRVLTDATAKSYDGLVLPGGVINADSLRGEEAAVDFVTEFVATGMPIAVICHGAWILIEADAVHDRTITSWHSLKTDLQNAGATWVDREVVTDHGMVSSRCPDDLPAFNRKMIEEFAEGKHRAAKKATQPEDESQSDEALQVRH